MTGNPFSFASSATSQLVMERIMSQSVSSIFTPFFLFLFLRLRLPHLLPLLPPASASTSVVPFFVFVFLFSFLFFFPPLLPPPTYCRRCAAVVLQWYLWFWFFKVVEVAGERGSEEGPEGDGALMEDKFQEWRSLALTPTWSAETVLTIFFAVSLLVERSNLLLWGFVITFMLFDINGSDLYFWIAIIPIALVLLVGSKLQQIIATLTLESAGINGFFTRCKLKPQDKLFWFKKPELLLSLIHFVLFQNAFELASFF